MKKLLSVFLAAVLALSLAAHALAFEDLNPPLWQQMGFDSYEDMLDLWTEEEYQQQVEEQRAYLAWEEGYKAAHPDEIAAFDPDAYFKKTYGDDWSKADYMSAYGLKGEADFDAFMMGDWLFGLYHAELERQEIADYTAAHPDEIAAFDPDAYFEQYLRSFFGSKEQYMEMAGITTEEGFYNAMLRAYIRMQEGIQQSKAQWAALQAAEPERTAEFLAGLDSWLKNSFGASSLAPFMELYHIDCEEEAYLLLFDMWNAEYEAEQAAIRERNAFITERGGVPGELGVMLNGRYLSFPDGRGPIMRNGSVYADAGTLSAVLNISLPAPIDEYVPVRAAGQAAGLTVLWDKNYQTAVLLDEEAAAAQVDGDFSVLNGALSKWVRDSEKNYRTDMTVKADMTMFDSLDGDKTGSVTATLSLLRGPKGLQATGSYDFASLMELLYAQPGSYYVPTEEELAQLKVLTKGDFECRADFAGGKAYLKMSLMDWLNAQSGALYAAGSWYAAEMDGAAAAESLVSKANTVGGYLVDTAVRDGYSPALLYDQILEAGGEVAKVFGDKCFASEGSGRKLSLDQSGLAELLGVEEDDPYGGYYYGLPDKFDLQLTVRADGALSGSLLYQGADYGYYSYGATRVTADFTISPTHERLEMEIHTKNAFKLVIALDATTAETAREPDVTPPDGAMVEEM